MDEEELYQKFVELLPVMYETAAAQTEQDVNQHIAAMVIDEIGDNQVAVDYISSFNLVTLQPDRRVLNFAAVTDKVHFLDQGISSFSIKDKMLARKSKISKDGYRYRTIPIQKEVGMDRKTSKMTAKEKVSMDEIRKIVEGSRFSLQFRGANKDTGEYYVQDRTSGLIRQRAFSDLDRYRSGGEPNKTRYIVFKTMSSKPGTSEWMHPGTKGKDLANEAQKWHKENDWRIFNEHIDDLMDLYFGD